MARLTTRFLMLTATAVLLCLQAAIYYTRDRCSVACTEGRCVPAYSGDESNQITRSTAAQGSSEDTASARGASATTDMIRSVATTKGQLENATTDYPFDSDTGNHFTNTPPFGTKGGLNLDVWMWPVGFLVDDLRIKRDFPHKPSIRTFIESLKVEFNQFAGVSNERGKYGHRLYGLLHPSTTGEYSFIVEMTHITCAFSVELWLSTDHNPTKSKKIIATEHSDAVLPPNTTVSPILYMMAGSGNIQLESGRAYYFEFLEKAFNGRVITEVKWRTPEGSMFTSIPPSCFAMAVELDGRGQYVPSPMATALLRPLPSQVLQGHRKIKSVTDNVVSDLSVLPSCEFSAGYVSKHRVKRFRGVYEVFESSVYPVDETWFYRRNTPDIGNNQTDPKVVERVLELYKKALQSSSYQNDNVRIYQLEETINGRSGSRFHLEMELKPTGNGASIYTSEYVYLPAGSNELCHTTNFQWTPRAFVYLVTSLKNLGQWLKHLVENVEDLYAQTHDDHFELVVVDYDSQDMDVESVLKNSTLKRWKYIKKSGPFSRSGGLQAGIDYVTDPNSIVMTIDMHLTLPMGFVEYTRKHVIQGKMGYTPMFFRLGPGYTEINVNGFWEVLTYGVLALFKSDWSTVGGFNVRRFADKWGGEDWDVIDRVVSNGYEVFRLRHPGLFHYYHSWDGMWGNKTTHMTHW
eukprot:Em0018g683a